MISFAAKGQGEPKEAGTRSVLSKEHFRGFLHRAFIMPRTTRALLQLTQADALPAPHSALQPTEKIKNLQGSYGVCRVLRKHLRFLKPCCVESLGFNWYHSGMLT